MALIDRVRERTGTDLGDTEISAMIAGIADEIAGRFGASGEITVTIGDPVDRHRWKQTLTLARPLDPSQAVAIVELEPANSGSAAAEIPLDAGDYRVLHEGRTLQRLADGPHGHTWWAPMVRLTYTPVGQAAARDEVTIKLIQLDLSYRGLIKSERAGDYQWAGSVSSDSYAAEREKLIASLGSSGMVMA